MLLLSISTSTSRGSAAVLDGLRTLATASYSDSQGHAERLFSAIDDALREANVERSSLQAIACDIGPGSFTGVRVSIASAKGLALALGIPTLGVMSLEAVARSAFSDGRAKQGDVAFAVIDAKKGELFVAAFDDAGRLLLPPNHLPRSSIQEAIRVLSEKQQGKRNVVLVGELGDLTHEPDPSGADVGARHPSLPDAVWIGRIAAERWMADPNAAIDAEALEALYVRAPDAKLPT